MPEDSEIAPDVYRSPGGYRWAYPIDYLSVKGLVRKLLTLVEATGMSSQQAKAVKSLVNQTVYGWFEDEQENDRGSAPGSGWNPVRVLDEIGDNEGRVPHMQWTRNGHDELLLKNRGRSTSQAVACLKWVDEPHPEDAFQVMWIGDTESTGTPTRKQMAEVWAALDHALISAPPFFKDEDRCEEADESVLPV